jgi:hypothetical protein
MFHRDHQSDISRTEDQAGERIGFTRRGYRYFRFGFSAGRNAWQLQGARPLPGDMPRP